MVYGTMALNQSIRGESGEQYWCRCVVHCIEDLYTNNYLVYVDYLGQLNEIHRWINGYGLHMGDYYNAVNGRRTSFGELVDDYMRLYRVAAVYQDEEDGMDRDDDDDEVLNINMPLPYPDNIGRFRFEIEQQGQSVGEDTSEN